jgi:hypothetical protein
MIIEWVDGGIAMGTDWRPGLASIISKRLARFSDAEIAALKRQLAEAEAKVRNMVTLSEVAKHGAHLRARVETLEAALKSFLHLTKRSTDDDAGTDALTDLPDSHPFELTWGSGYPQITVGQIKRARTALSGKD